MYGYAKICLSIYLVMYTSIVGIVAIIDKATINIHIQVFVQTYAFISLRVFRSGKCMFTKE